MSRTAALMMLAAALAAAPLGCGGDDGSGSDPPANPRALLDRAFAGSVTSAHVSADFDFELRGASPLPGPVRVALEGPYLAGSAGFPRFDWQGTAEVLGFEVELELVSFGDDLLVSTYGEGYELGAADFAALSERLSGVRPAPGELAGPVRYEGREEVDGTETHHLAAELDPRRASERLIPLQAALGLSESPAPVGRIDAWVGVEDELPRRLAVDLDFGVPPEDRDAMWGARRVEAQLEVELGEVNEPQALPERPRGVYKPISELVDAIRELGAYTN